MFRSYETVSGLGFGYWNQAHQDYAQVVMEGGVFGAALIVAFIVWYVLSVGRISRRPDPSGRVQRQQTAAAVIILLVLLHSAVRTIRYGPERWQPFSVSPPHSSSRPRTIRPGRDAFGRNLADEPFSIYKQG